MFKFRVWSGTQALSVFDKSSVGCICTRVRAARLFSISRERLNAFSIWLEIDLEWEPVAQGDSSRSADSVVPGLILCEAGWWTNGRFTFALAALGTG